MATRPQHNLSIMEAVETLSSLADLEFDREIGIDQKHDRLVQSEKDENKQVNWVQEHEGQPTVVLVREIFKVILHYLKHFYKKEYGYQADDKTIEGIKTIMVLVGEAAKKLDRYTDLFKETKNKSVTQFKEYKQLQEFYQSKIARKIDESLPLSKWIFGLAVGRWQVENEVTFQAIPSVTETIEESKHIFVDMEAVKKDTEYELFFIRKDDGSRFFNPRLLRNIKLVCDFGSYLGDRPEIDPLEAIKMWHDRLLQGCAKNIVKALGPRLQQFYHDMRKYKNQELVVIVNKVLIALLLSSHAHNLLRHNPTKSCGEYFEDFQHFLREALQNRNYQKWLAYPPNSDNHLGADLMEIIHTICKSLYVHLQGLQDISVVIQELVTKGHEKISKEHIDEAKSSKAIWNRLALDYAGMTKLIKQHPNGPLLKVLDILDEDAYHLYDPLLQHNIPNQLYDLYLNDQRIANIRMAAPVYQEVISKAVVDEEFKGFIRSYAQLGQKHLLINLQDRTSWKEHARSIAVEELQSQSGFDKALAVATLATDTEFYHQLAPYHKLNHVKAFMEQFKEHLLSESSGFFYPDAITEKEFTQFVDQTLEAVHRIFFSSKNVLLKEDRLDFIEIFYLFLELKLIEWIQPTSFSLTCKDGVDMGQIESAELFIFLQLINNHEWVDSDWEYLNLMLYGPALIIRERIILPERFNRMVSVIRTIENARTEFGPENFSKIVQEGFLMAFKTPILHSSLLMPRAA